MAVMAVEAFLSVPTPEAWVDEALKRLPELLLDHANCELKAASSALGMLYRYPERAVLAQRMSRLAREELRHFEQVRALMDELGIAFARLSASRYAGALREAVRPGEPERLLDLLLVGALIEARSCERFARLAPRLPESLSRFYAGLLASEARHFEHYLQSARTESGMSAATVDLRMEELLAIESGLVSEPDPQFRFHSGPPAQERLPAARWSGG
jgi:tRNA 2-(methylsulfanyl)-N6-isopentenyladenosine37 hydroxylase